MKYRIRLLAAAGIACLVLAFAGCGPRPPVVTSTGAVVASSTVETQDALADVIHELKGLQAQAVADYEAAKPTMTTEDRANRYAVLTANADALDASWAALLAWKRGTEGMTADQVVAPLVRAVPQFLALLVRAKILTPTQAHAIRVVIDSKGRTAKPVAALRPSEPRGPVLIGYDPLTLRVNPWIQTIGNQDLAHYWYDGCNWCYRDNRGNISACTLRYCGGSALLGDYR